MLITSEDRTTILLRFLSFPQHNSLNLPVSVIFEEYEDPLTCLSLTFRTKRQQVHSFFANPKKKDTS